MSWDLTGKKVIADHKGILIYGTVESSFLGHTSEIKHKVILAKADAAVFQVTRLFIPHHKIISAV